jgi:hypothetical protein
LVAVDRGEVGIVALERLAVAEDGAQPCEALITGDVGGATFKFGRILSGSLGRLARLRWTFGSAMDMIASSQSGSPSISPSL